MAVEDERSQLNIELWARAVPAREYVNGRLREAERRLLNEFRADFAGRVLELGCGAGRLAGHMIENAEKLHGIDIAPAMVAYCRRVYPQGSFSERDLRDLSSFETATFEAVVAGYNVLDVLNHAERGRTLDEIRRLLVPGGLLVMSSHNRHFQPLPLAAAMVVSRNPARVAGNIARLARRIRNRRRLRPLERQEDEYALINDSALDFSLLHYYISPEDQARQLREHGFALLECLTLDGRSVTPGDRAAGCSELHYAARVDGSRRRTDGATAA